MLKAPKINIVPPLMQTMSVVPCEYCGAAVPFKKYEEHLITHGEDAVGKEDDKEMDTSPPLMRGSLMIACEVCGEIIPYQKHKAHLNAHSSAKQAVPLPGI